MLSRLFEQLHLSEKHESSMQNRPIILDGQERPDTKKRVMYVQEGLMKAAQYNVSPNFNRELDAIFAKDHCLSIDTLSSILRLHSEFKSEDEVQKYVTAEEIAQHDRLGTIDYYLNEHRSMKSPEFVMNLEKALKHKDLKMNMYWVSNGQYAFSAIKAAQLRSVNQQRDCACGNPNGGMESSIHSVSGCYP